jgi:transcriptional regulator with XRE-family HTH domain
VTAGVLKGEAMAQSYEHLIKIRIPAGFSGRLRRAREARGWTPADLALALDIQASTIKSWESGQVFWISVAALDALATALEVEPAWLLTRPMDDV